MKPLDWIRSASLNRLFVKLLGWLLLANLVTAAAVFVLARSLVDPPLSARSVQTWGQQAIAAYEAGGRRALLGNLNELRHEQHALGMLYGPDGRPLLRHVAKKLRLRSHDGRRRPGHGARYDEQLVQWLEGERGRYRWVVVTLPPNPHDFARLRLIAGLVGIVLAAWLLAWWLSRPIRQLRHATGEMAAGRLSARVSKKLTRRRDELGQLGHEFNAMAARLQSQIESGQQLLRDVSHELRSPLARLEVALEVARSHADDSERGRQALDRIALESSRLDALLEQVLTWSRLQHQERPLAREPVALAELLEQCAADLTLISEVPIDIKATAQPVVDGDPVLLRSVVENLLRNAQHYTAPGTRVRAEVDQDGGMAVLNVRDHGPGVPEHMLDSIFEPFVRTSQARDRHTRGHGTAPAILAPACQAHGGTVTAHNRPEGGLEVCVRLPMSG